MITNPAQYFINGSTVKKFTYDEGTMPFNFQPKDCGLTSSRESNVLIFANNIRHAKEIIEKLFIFKRECLIKNRLSKLDREIADIEYYDDKLKTELIKIDDILNNKDKWVINHCPKNQPYLISWASNDTI